jgi:AcrR family transcriptional regulator
VSAAPLLDSTRTRIISVALQLFTENGFGATTTREIAAHVAITKAALHYHFRTKDDLLAELVAPAFQGLKNLIETTPPEPTVAQRRQLLADYVDLTIASADLMQAFASDPSMARRPVLRSQWQMYQQLAALLAGTPHPDAATQTQVQFAIGGIHACLRRRDRTKQDQEQVRVAALTAACGALGIRRR